MKHAFAQPCLRSPRALAATAACACLLPFVHSPAVAQAGGGGVGSPGWSAIPGTSEGYVGISLGRSEYDLDCGIGATSCDDPDFSGKLSVGGWFNEWVGLEGSYLHIGPADRAGGRTRAQGFNLSGMVRYPFGDLSVFGKAGLTYGRTRVNGDVLSGEPLGQRNGWGGAFGVGAAWDFGERSGVALEWERHQFRFAGGGSGKADVDTVWLGYRHRF